MERVKDVDGFGESHRVNRPKRVPVEVHYHLEHPGVAKAFQGLGCRRLEADLRIPERPADTGFDIVRRRAQVVLTRGPSEPVSGPAGATSSATASSFYAYRHIGKRATRAGYEREDLASLAADDLVQALAPEIECGPFLEFVAMPVIDRRHARLDVVENLRDDEPGHARANHQARRGAPQVMTPKGDPGGPNDPFDRLLRMGDVRAFLAAAPKTHGESSTVSRHVLRMRTACGERGTRCASPFLLRSAGIVHQPLLRRAIRRQVLPQ
jgi:hypothetical protein